MGVYERLFRRVQKSLEKETKDVPDTLSVSKYQIQYLLRENRYIHKTALKIKDDKTEKIIALSEMLDRKIFEIMGKEYNFFRLRPNLKNQIEKENQKYEQEK